MVGWVRDFDEKEMAGMLYHVSTAGPDNIGIGIAGGLSHDNLARLRPFLSEYYLSIDAEGKLRDADDHLDLAKATLYLQAANKLFRECKQAA